MEVPPGNGKAIDLGSVGMNFISFVISKFRERRFISPVDKVETRGLSQVVTSFQSDGLGKKPFLSLVQSGSRYVFAVDGARSVIYDSGTDAAERGSFVGLTSLRPTLLSPPPHPSASFDRRFRLYFCLVVSGAVILLLVLVVIVAAI